VAGNGKFCPENPDRDDPCRTEKGGMNPRAIPANEFGKWKSYNGEVLFSVDANRLGKFESTLAWPDPEASAPAAIRDKTTTGALNAQCLSFGNGETIPVLSRATSPSSGK
jgi:hypothetical protein